MLAFWSSKSCFLVSISPKFYPLVPLLKTTGGEGRAKRGESRASNFPPVFLGNKHGWAGFDKNTYMFADEYPVEETKKRWAAMSLHERCVPGLGNEVLFGLIGLIVATPAFALYAVLPMSVVGPTDPTQLRRVSWFCLFMCAGLMNGLVEVADLLKLEEDGKLYVENQASWMTANGPRVHSYAGQWGGGGESEGKQKQTPPAAAPPPLDGFSCGNAMPGFGPRADGGPAWRDLVWVRPVRANVSEWWRILLTI